MLTSRCMIALAGVLAVIFLTPRTVPGTTTTSPRPSEIREDGRVARDVRLFMLVPAGASAARAQSASFEWIPGEISGSVSSQVNSVSGDGEVVAGNAMITLNGSTSSRHALWRETEGWVALGSLADYAFQHWVWDLSANGSVAVGNGPFVQHGSRQPVMWVGGSATNLPLLSGSNRGDARAVSADGSVIVGENRITGLGQRAVRWRGGAPEDLGTLPGASGSHVATAVSADGETVAGTSFGAQVAWRWTEALGMHSLGTPGGTFSAAYDVSADGRVVVGFGYTGTAESTSHGFRWTEQAGMEILPFVGEEIGQANRAKGVSADGDIVVGRASSGAVIWRPGEPGRLLRNVLLEDHDITLPGDVVLDRATGISADGTVIVGEGRNGGVMMGWRAVLPRAPVFFWEGLSGDFADETNWAPVGVPGPSDLAIFDKDQDYTVSFGDESSSQAWVERGTVAWSGGSYTLGGGSEEMPSLLIGNDAAGIAGVALVNGHALNTTFATLGRQSDNEGRMVVSSQVGAPALWTNQGRLVVAKAGGGEIIVEPGARLVTDELIIGDEPGSTGTVLFPWTDGHGQAGALGAVAVGKGGTGTLTVENAIVFQSAALVGVQPGSEGEVIVRGLAIWQTGELTIGAGGNGKVRIEQGGYVVKAGAEPMIIGREPGSFGELVISGEGARLDSQDFLTVGLHGGGDIRLEAGGRLSAEQLMIGSDGSGEVTVTGVGTDGTPSAVLLNRLQGQDIYVGSGSGHGALIALDGALVIARSISLGLFDQSAGIGVIESASWEADFVFVGAVQPGGAEVPSSSLVLRDGELTTNALFVQEGGGIFGAGTIWLLGDEPAEIHGTIAPGVVIWEPGAGERRARSSLHRSAGFASLMVDGDLELDGILELSVGGAVPGQADQLIVSGDMVLGEATLRLNFTDGYGPQEGDALSLVTVGGAFAGAFGEVVITGLEEGFEYDLDLEGGEVVLVALNDATVGIGSEPGETLPDPEPVITALRLHPNQPNPFNPQTVIVYEVPQSGAVRLEVFDLRGRLVRTLVDGALAAGRHEVLWDGRDAQGHEQPSGVYLSRLRSSEREATGRMTLVR